MHHSSCKVTNVIVSLHLATYVACLTTDIFLNIFIKYGGKQTEAWFDGHEVRSYFGHWVIIISARSDLEMVSFLYLPFNVIIGLMQIMLCNRQSLHMVYQVHHVESNVYSTCPLRYWFNTTLRPSNIAHMWFSNFLRLYYCYSNKGYCLHASRSLTYFSWEYFVICIFIYRYHWFHKYSLFSGIWRPYTLRITKKSVIKGQLFERIQQVSFTVSIILFKPICIIFVFRLFLPHTSLSNEKNHRLRSRLYIILSRHDDALTRKYLPHFWFFFRGRYQSREDSTH